MRWSFPLRSRAGRGGLSRLLRASFPWIHLSFAGLWRKLGEGVEGGEQRSARRGAQEGGGPVPQDRQPSTKKDKTQEGVAQVPLLTLFSSWCGFLKSLGTPPLLGVR